jgi:hypothetical protein
MIRFKNEDIKTHLEQKYRINKYENYTGKIR